MRTYGVGMIKWLFGDRGLGGLADNPGRVGSE